MGQTTELVVIGWKVLLAIIGGSGIVTASCICLLARFTHAFDAYAGERAKLLAQFRNLDKLVEQTAKLTETTKQIESRVSYDLWDRQMRLTYLRDTYTKLMEGLARLRLCQLTLRTQQEVFRKSAPSDPMPDERMQAVAENGVALSDLVKIRDIALLVIPEELFHFLEDSISELRGTHAETWQEDCRHNVALIEQAILRVRHTARIDLGYDSPPKTAQ